MINNFNIKQDDTEWASMTPKEKNNCLYRKQVALLDTFLEHGAISQAEHDKSQYDLAIKMGKTDNL